MRKISLITASIVVSALSAAASSAYASTVNTDSTYCKPGFYAGLQMGRSKTYYQPSSILGPAVANEYANSANMVSDLEVGDIGYYDPDQITTDFRLVNQHSNDIGIGGRVYAGYQFNTNFAMEMGYNQFAKTEVYATGVNTATGTYNGEGTYSDKLSTTTAYRGELTQHAIDLVGKLTMPIPGGLGVYVKGGAAYVASHRYINVITGPTNAVYIDNGNEDDVYNVNGSSRGTLYTKDYQGILPVAGGGIEYTVPNTNLSFDISYEQLFGRGGFRNASLTTFGGSYKFA